MQFVKIKQARGIKWISFLIFLLQFILVFQATLLVSALNLNILQVIFGVALIAEVNLGLLQHPRWSAL